MSTFHKDHRDVLIAPVVSEKSYGLLDANNQWLRRRFEELGVIQFEDWADTEAEYEAFALAELH